MVDILLSLSDAGDTAACRQLLAHRQAYEALMHELFTLYQSETVVAPCSGILIDPVTVTTGLSDGLTVELTSGLMTGDTYYYACYDTPDISETPDFGSGFSRLPFGK